MSTQKGNLARSRPQKHQNRTVFKNNLHDTSHKTKAINSTQINNVCQRCKEIIEWKIKYKVYKPLTQPKKCTKCERKNVKQAYHLICTECGHKLGVCTKCGHSREIVPAPPSKQEQIHLDEEMKELLKTLPERKRRTFLCYLKKCEENPEPADQKTQKEEIVNKLNSLKLNEDEDDLDDFLDHSDNDDDE